MANTSNLLIDPKRMRLPPGSTSAHQDVAIATPPSTVLVVDGDNGDDNSAVRGGITPWKTISAALLAAHDFDTIKVYPGYFPEDLEIPANIQGLTIEGAGVETTWLDGFIEWLPVLSIDTEGNDGDINIFVRNMTIEDGVNVDTSGMVSLDDNELVVQFTLENCGISDSTYMTGRQNWDDQLIVFRCNEALDADGDTDASDFNTTNCNSQFIRSTIGSLDVYESGFVWFQHSVANWNVELHSPCGDSDTPEIQAVNSQFWSTVYIDDCVDTFNTFSSCTLFNAIAMGAYAEADMLGCEVYARPYNQNCECAGQVDRRIESGTIDTTDTGYYEVDFDVPFLTGDFQVVLTDTSDPIAGPVPSVTDWGWDFFQINDTVGNRTIQWTVIHNPTNDS